jgi:hypothetical protein
VRGGAREVADARVCAIGARDLSCARLPRPWTGGNDTMAARAGARRIAGSRDGSARDLGMHGTPRWQTTREHWWQNHRCGSELDGPVRKLAIVFREPVLGRFVDDCAPKSHAPDVSAHEILYAGLMGATGVSRSCVVPTASGPFLVVIQSEGEVKTVYPRQTQGADPRCPR